jgi:hypothetical protein
MQWRSFGMGFSLLGQWLSKYAFFFGVVGYSGLMDLFFDSTIYLAVTPTALAQVSWRFFFL